MCKNGICLVLLLFIAISFATVMTFVSPTDANNTYINHNYTFINFTLGATENATIGISWNNTNISTSGLLGWWKFDEGYGNITVDSSGNNYTGILIGALPAWTYGKYNNSLNFNGRTGYVNITNLNYNFSNTNQFTVSLWLMTDSNMSFGGCCPPIIGKGWGNATVSQGEFLVWLTNTTKKIRLTVFNGSTTGQTIESVSSLASNSNWNHLSFVVDYAAKIGYIYINGLLDKSSVLTLQGTLPSTTNRPIEIGHGTNNWGGYWNGSIDEVMFLNRALSANEIKMVYQSQLPQFVSLNITDLVDGTYSYYVWANDTSGNFNMTETRTLTIDTILPTITLNSPTDPNNALVNRNNTYINATFNDTNTMTAFMDWNRSLVGWWRMGDASNSTHIFDNSTYNNHGALKNGASITQSGKFGNGMSFDGVNDYMQLPNSAVFNMSGDYSISAWVYIAGNGTPSGNYEGFVTKAWNYNFGRNTANGRFMLQFYNGTGYENAQSTAALAFNSWYYIAGVWNDTSRTIRLYINGVLNRTTNTVGEPALSTTAPVIGAGSTSSQYTNGTIDEVRIYNRALSAMEINASYSAGLYRLEANMTNLPDKTYNYTIYVQDSAGNINSTTRNITIDTTSILINIQNPINRTYNASYSANFSVNYTVSEIPSSCKYSLNGNANVTLPSCTNSSIIASQGYNSIVLWVNDSVNNWNYSSLSFTYDNISISINLVNPLPITYTSANMTFNYTTSENPISCKYELNYVNHTIPCGNATFTATQGLLNSFMVWVNDSADNWNASQRVFFFVEGHTGGSGTGGGTTTTTIPEALENKTNYLQTFVIPEKDEVHIDIRQMNDPLCDNNSYVRFAIRIDNNLNASTIGYLRYFLYGNNQMLQPQTEDAYIRAFLAWEGERTIKWDYLDSGWYKINLTMIYNDKTVFYSKDIWINKCQNDDKLAGYEGLIMEVTKVMTRPRTFMLNGGEITLLQGHILIILLVVINVIFSYMGKPFGEPRTMKLKYGLVITIILFAVVNAV